MDDTTLRRRVIRAGEDVGPSIGIAAALKMKGGGIVGEIIPLEIAFSPFQRTGEIPGGVYKLLAGSGQVDERAMRQPEPGRKLEERTPHVIGAMEILHSDGEVHDRRVCIPHRPCPRLWREAYHLPARCLKIT